METAKKTAYSYVRFSTDEQAKGDSQRRQVSESRAYCDEQGFILDETLKVDAGVSAFRGKNLEKGELGRFLDLIEAGRVKPGSVLVIESLDRLSRQPIDDQYDLWRKILNAGVEIHTLKPRNIYTKASRNDIGKLFEAIIIMSRAAEESSIKSDRVRKAWSKKRKNIEKEKLTAACPNWLKLNEDRTKYIVIEEYAKIIKRIFAMTRDDLGTHLIARQLNKEGIKPISKNNKLGLWHQSTIAGIQRNRAVLGEYTPKGVINETGIKGIIGKPIPDYYPRIISDAEWYATRTAVESRKTFHGKLPTDKIGNLLTQLMFNARDKKMMTVIRRGTRSEYRYLQSLSKDRGLDGDRRVIKYGLIEEAFLRFVKEIKPSSILPKQFATTESQVEAVEARQLELDKEIEAVRKRYDASRSELLLDILLTQEAEKKELAVKLDTLKMTASNPVSASFTETQSLIDALRDCPKSEKDLARRRLRASIRRIIKSIWICLFDLHNGTRVAEVQVYFKVAETEQGEFGRRFVVAQGRPSGPKKGICWMASGGSKADMIPSRYNLKNYSGWYDVDDPMGVLIDKVGFGHFEQLQLNTSE